jgi:hypothetical protein
MWILLFQPAKVVSPYLQGSISYIKRFGLVFFNTTVSQRTLSQEKCLKLTYISHEMST